jgi:hypothetical protein
LLRRWSKPPLGARRRLPEDQPNQEQNPLNPVGRFTR